MSKAVKSALQTISELAYAPAATEEEELELLREIQMAATIGLENYVKERAAKQRA